MLRPLLFAFLVGVPLLATAQSSDSTLAWVQGGPYRLKVAISKSPTQTDAPTLVVVLHGDSPFAKPDYQDRFAAAVARAHSNTVVAAILRPGYTDPAGRTSDGERGQTTGDNWNAQNTDALAAAIATLRDQFHSPRLVLVGHSGGAALSANILARHPGLAQAALLVSCPCDVPSWRAHMLRKAGFEGFRGDIQTLSPLALVDGLSPKVRIQLIVGEQDDVAPPALTQAYAAALQKRGIAAATQVLSGEGHDILLRPEVLKALGPLLP